MNWHDPHFWGLIVVGVMLLGLLTALRFALRASKRAQGNAVEISIQMLAESGAKGLDL